VIRLIPALFLLIGLFFLVQVGLPIVNFKLWELGNNSQSLVSPEVGSGVLGVSIEISEDNFPSIISNFHRDYTPYTQFSLSVPAINIEEARVFVDSNDLSKGLAHLPGSSLPGERGNVFISGHSALPIIFNGNKNYGAIFANLENLKKGDLIKVSAGGEYDYKVLEVKEIDPKDLSVVRAPDPSERYITLMTCVPPGLNTKRLVVLGKMI